MGFRAAATITKHRDQQPAEAPGAEMVLQLLLCSHAGSPRQFWNGFRQRPDIQQYETQTVLCVGYCIWCEKKNMRELWSDMEKYCKNGLLLNISIYNTELHAEYFLLGNDRKIRRLRRLSIHIFCIYRNKLQTNIQEASDVNGGEMYILIFYIILVFKSFTICICYIHKIQDKTHELLNLH